MILRYYLNKDGNKVYTLKKSISEKETKEAHYKFLKFVDKLE